MSYPSGGRHEFVDLTKRAPVIEPDLTVDVDLYTLPSLDERVRLVRRHWISNPHSADRARSGSEVSGCELGAFEAGFKEGRKSVKAETLKLYTAEIKARLKATVEAIDHAIIVARKFCADYKDIA